MRRSGGNLSAFIGEINGDGMDGLHMKYYDLRCRKKHEVFFKGWRQSLNIQESKLKRNN
jgi:hypothetical protein